MRRRSSLRQRWLVLAALATAVVLMAVPAWAQDTTTDSDGDGIIDAFDCQPWDPRVASLHVYYFDLDGDLRGNAGNSAALCDAKPFPGTVLWHGDPNDSDPQQSVTVVPKGPRKLGLDFGDTALDGQWRPDLARELGVDATTLHLLWNQIESTPGTYTGPQVGLLDMVAAVYAEQGLSLNLTLSPLTQTYLALPTDLAKSVQEGKLRMDSPEVTYRFGAFMAFVRKKLGNVPIQALNIGHEVDRYLQVRSDVAFWSQYTTFFATARLQARFLWNPSISVGITATSTGLTTSPSSALLAAINAAADHVSVTYRPRAASFGALSAETIRPAVASLVAAAFPKPVMFQTVSAPSAVATFSSTTAQAQFYEAFFSVWDEYPSVITFASIGRLFDWPADRAASEAMSPHIGATEQTLATAIAYFQSLGLRDYQYGGAKAGYDTVRTLAFERGWWRDPLSTTRSTLHGFVPALYDREGTAIDPVVLANTANRIGEAGDMMLLQFDNGVPWPEALVDTGVGPLPYSANLRETWEMYRAVKPAGARLAIAINPIGIPRHRLAPYWGYGEDYVLDENFEPVGTGEFRDFETRLLPPEWRHRDWTDPEVKVAFTNYAKRAIQFFSPDYLIIAVEANLALDRDPAAYVRFLELQAYVYQALKADPQTARVPILVSFVAEHLLVDRTGNHYLIDGLLDPEGLRTKHLQALAATAPFVDMFGFSTYPIKSQLGAYRPPTALFDLLMETVRLVTNKPVAITETGYPSTTFTVYNQYFNSSPAKQEAFYRLMFAEAEKHQFEFVISYTPYDMTPFMDKLRLGAQQDPPTVSPDLIEFYKFFEFMGLFNLADSSARPAGQFLKDYIAKPYVHEGGWIPPVSISSPSGSLHTWIGVTGGTLYYSIEGGGRQLLEASPLGQIVDGQNLGALISSIELSDLVDVDESYPIRGVKTTARNRYRGATLTLRRGSGADRVVQVEFRVFDDGVAYRYVVPGAGPRTIGGEVSAWTLPEGSRIWHQVNTENYEANYRGTPLGYFNDDVGGPVTAELPGGGFVLLTEAALRRYAGLTYDFDLAQRTIRGEFLDSTSWTIDGGEKSPWRVVIATGSLNDLVNSDVVSNLNPPPDATLFPNGLDTSWVKPGRAVWSWWSDNTSGFQYDIQHDYIDLAHQLRTEYQVIDAGWESSFASGGADSFQRLAALVQYARVQWRDVGLWVWKYWYELADPVARNQFFAQVAAAGAVGVKIDNVYGYQSESFSNVELTEAILRDAASHKLLINLHGVGKSTGLQRTYPNELTREGFMGLELNGLAWDQGLFVEPDHNAATPFVRLVAGPGDYTPVTLDPRKIGNTTFGHQLATAGIFTSPMQHWADNPAVLLQQPAAVDLLRTLPVVWDETRVLAPSEIGRLALFARRAAGRWYVFAINGDRTTGRTLQVPLDFLGSGSWKATTFADGTQTSFQIRTLAGLTGTSSLNVVMLPGGGFSAVIELLPDKSRRVLQGFTSIAPEFTGEGWQQLYTTIRDHGDIVSHSLQSGVPWPEALASTDPSTYSEQLKFFWNLMRSADRAVVPTIPRYLMINPLDVATYSGLAPYYGVSDAMALPAPWNTYELDHPNVIQAFTNYCIAAIEYFNPTFVAIGVESNILLAHEPQKWAAYKRLNQAVYQALKQRYPSLAFFVTIHYEQMLGLFRESDQLAQQVRSFYPDVLEREVVALMEHSDLFAISTYPFMAQNNILIGQSQRLDRDYYDRALALARESGRPLAIDQAGMISQDLFVAADNVTLPGSDETQQAYVDHLLAFAHLNDAVFAFNFVAMDYGSNYGDDPTMATWAYTGLRRLDGSNKPALAVWDAYRVEVSGGGGGTGDPGGDLSPTFETLAARIAAMAGDGWLDLVGTSLELPSPELFVRWQQLASFLPEFDVPPADDPTAPYDFANPYRAAAVKTLARRTLWLSYLQPLFDAFTATGEFASQVLSAPEEPPLVMIGDWLLLAPVVEAGVSSRVVDLPAGVAWWDWNAGQLHMGGQQIVVDAPLDIIPMFIKVVF